MLKSANSDFPEPGQNEEHTGEPHSENELSRDTEAGCEQDQNAALRQKGNQNKT